MIDRATFIATTDQAIDAAIAASGQTLHRGKARCAMLALLDLHHGDNLYEIPLVQLRTDAAAAAKRAVAASDYSFDDPASFAAYHDLRAVVARWSDRMAQRVERRMAIDPVYRERILARRAQAAQARDERHAARLRSAMPLTA